jgi:hypothetical protein
MKKLSLAIALLMFLIGFAYGQNRQCNTYEAICSLQIVSCVKSSGTCPTGQCGNPDQAGCCLYENGYCLLTGTFAETVVCGNSCNP